jgi:hypothetical protein
MTMGDKDKVRVGTGNTPFRNERVDKDFFCTGEQYTGMAKPGKMHICQWECPMDEDCYNGCIYLEKGIGYYRDPAGKKGGLRERNRTKAFFR